jgi:alkylation response protein AidB-like acyl-CoA dehydrogenase/predicted heme/steroid binding protein
MAALKRITREEVAKNNTEDSLWVIVDARVYDLTDFLDAHPGGVSVLTQVAGTDATTAFYNLHRHEVIQKFSNLCIGTVEGEEPQVIDEKPGDLSQVPYGEPTWLTPVYKSPYYKESHRRLQRAVRVWVDEVLKPEAQEKELSGERISDEVIDAMGRNNLLAMRLGLGRHLLGRRLMDGAVEPEEFDCFHELTIVQEFVRVSARGFQDGILAGMVIALPAVLNFANSESLRRRVADECFSGKKKICLAITEAFAGSDVAGMKTTARLSEDGKFYVVNGTKKWITNGAFCDYFVTGVKTDKGFSVLLVERQEGLETKSIKTSYSAAAGTTYVTYDNVKVPVENLLGKEHEGFQVILGNFNHERWMMCGAIIRQSRSVVEECLKWSNQRLVFGKRLIDQPVIRQKYGPIFCLWFRECTKC